MSTPPQQPAIDDDVVHLSVPADSAYLGVLRTATAGLAARLHFDLDEIEDLRIAVDEACAMLLSIAAGGSDLHCRFSAAAEELAVEVSVRTAPGARLPSASSFTWRVLTALTSGATAENGDGQASIRLHAQRAD